MAMSVSLTPELERYINQKIESGLYQTASEVVRAGLRLLKEREELHQQMLEELRREIEIGNAEAERGELSPLDAEGTSKRLRAPAAKTGHRWPK
jgi:antitoxin ParD1/3/4